MKQHRLSKSNSELNLFKEQDNSSDNSMLIQKGLTFDKWLAHKLKARRLELLKKREEAKIDIIERFFHFLTFLIDRFLHYQVKKLNLLHFNLEFIF